MSLQDKLDGLRAQAETKRPPHVLAAMHQATADLIATGQAERALKAGDRVASNNSVIECLTELVPPGWTVWRPS